MSIAGAGSSNCRGTAMPTTILMLALSVIAADTNAATVGGEVKSFEGSWKVVRLESDGVEAPPEVLKGMRWSLKGAEWQWSDADGAVGKFAAKLDFNTSPIHIDLVGSKGVGKGTTSQGIFKFDQNRLV